MGSTSTALAIAEAARNRRSYRDYAADPVSASEVGEVLALAAKAPSAWNLQPWRFVVVTDPETKEALKGASFGQKQVAGAPVLVVLYSDMVDAIGKVDEILDPAIPADAREGYKQRILGSFARMTDAQSDEWGKAQAYIALGYLLLLLEAHGFASSPMLGFDPAAVRKILSLPDRAQIPALIAIGRPTTTHPGPQHRLAPQQIIRYVEGPTG